MILLLCSIARPHGHLRKPASIFSSILDSGVSGAFSASLENSSRIQSCSVSFGVCASVIYLESLQDSAIATDPKYIVIVQ